MQLKKNPKVDLESKKTLFLLIGITLSLSIVLVAFEWTSTNFSVASLGILADGGMEEEIENSLQNEEIEVPPEQQQEEIQEEQIIEELIIVDDTKVLEAIKIDTEASETTKTSTKPVVQAIVVEEEHIEPIQFAVVEEKPSFPDGDLGITKFITQNTVYPPMAKELGIQGRVYVQFVIDKNGKVTQVKIARGVDPLLDAEALRVVSKMPDWTPGKQRGKAVPVTNVLPISFSIK